MVRRWMTDARSATHPIQRRFLAEDLIRLRPASELSGNARVSENPRRQRQAPAD